jgi:hypothetical protein
MVVREDASFLQWVLARYRGASTPRRERRWQCDGVLRVAAAFDPPNQPDEPLDSVLGEYGRDPVGRLDAGVVSPST